jgi:hypothetical protein
MIGGGHRTDADSQKGGQQGHLTTDQQEVQTMFKVSRISQAVGSAFAVAGIVALAAAGIAIRDASEPNVRSLGPGDDFATRHAPQELVLTWADDYATRRSAEVELSTNDDYATRRSTEVELGTTDNHGIRLGR